MRDQASRDQRQKGEPGESSVRDRDRQVWSPHGWQLAAAQSTDSVLGVRSLFSLTLDLPKSTRTNRHLCSELLSAPIGSHSLTFPHHYSYSRRSLHTGGWQTRVRSTVSLAGCGLWAVAGWTHFFKTVPGSRLMHALAPFSFLLNPN